MNLLRFLIFFLLPGWILPIQVAAQESALLIQSVELIRRGKQVSIHLLTNGAPVYEVNENLQAKTLVIKFQNARLDFVDGRKERLFNDEQIAGIRFNKVDDAIWAQFKLRLSELSYEIEPLSELKQKKVIRDYLTQEIGFELEKLKGVYQIANNDDYKISWKTDFRGSGNSKFGEGIVGDFQARR